jgi:predicted transcriptional regulator
MSERVITIRVPDELYERLQEEAEASQRTPERVLIESAAVLLSPIKPPGNIDQEAICAY